MHNYLYSLRYTAVFVLLCILSADICAQDVRLVWSPSAGPEVVAYGVYRALHPELVFERISTVPAPDTTYLDAEIPPNAHHFYAVTAIDRVGNESAFSNLVDTTPGLSSAVLQPAGTSPAEFFLAQNHPNPMQPQAGLTTIYYVLPKSGHVRLTIHDGNGREVNKLVEENQEAGKYSTTWEGRNFEGRRVAVGIYYCKLEALNGIQVRKMILLH